MDETADSSSKTENEENVSGNDISNNESPQVCSAGIPTAPRLRCPVKKACESSQFMHKSPTVLRPSQLNGNVGNNVGCQKPVSSSFLLNPSRLMPFAKTTGEDENNDRDEQKTSDSSKSDSTAPKFLPLFQNGSKSEPAIKNITPTASTSAAVSRSSDFVFGQNIHDRVVSDSNKSEDAKSTSCTNANGTSDMLFSSALKDAPIPDSGCSSARCQGTKSLSESAREYEESRAIKRKYEEVEVRTGEEGETNVLQITCKLFAFDNAGGIWQERGRGSLRLNDQETGGDPSNSNSRLVFRTAGSFRVVLNTKIWAEMKVQRASDRSIRLTAFDSNGEVKVFLLTGTPEDVKQLQKHLEMRVKKETEKHKSSICHTASSQEPDSKKLAGESHTSN